MDETAASPTRCGSIARPSAGLQVSSSWAADVVLGVFAIVTTPAGIFPELDIPVVCGDLNSGGRALRPARGDRRPRLG
jgi:hypothetical protein